MNTKQNIFIRYFKSERISLPYEAEIPIFKFNHDVPYRYETIEIGTNKLGYTMYAVRSTNYSTVRYEDLQKKFKALKDLTEQEFLEPIN